MKWLQNGNLTKLVAFFVIAVVIVCTVSFAANGWQSFINDGNDDDNVTTDNSEENNEENKNTDGEDTNDDIPVIQPTPKYYHLITGLETTFEDSLKKPICISLESSHPLYGISSSYLTIEFPTEYGNTRLLCFTDEAKSLGKIGSIAPSRGYISNLATYFGGVLLSYGNDDRFKYNYDSPSCTLDFDAISGYCYTEYNTFVYTNGDLVNAFINNSAPNQSYNDKINLPYNFSSSEDNTPTGENATSVTITYSDNNASLLTYSLQDKQYIFTKSVKDASLKNDLLNDKPLKYDNVFILYADSTTHETEEDTQLILDTNTSGTGIYVSHGKYVEISWERTASGSLVFYNADGEILTVSRGTSYIGFAKASSKSSISIS